MNESKCKKCRRAGEKLFLKGSRCHTAKCAVVKRKYAPGFHGPKQMVRLSEYGKQLRNKQKLKRMYGLMEKQFVNYYKAALKSTGDTGALILQSLESRLDNVIYRIGLAESRAQARQLVSHGHFLVNGKKMNIPSYRVRTEDEITVRPKSKNHKLLKEVSKKLERQEIPSWIKFDRTELVAKVLSAPEVSQLKESTNITGIVEFYSR